MNPYFDIAGDVIAGAVEGLGKTAVAALDASKQRQFSQAVAAMSASEQKELNRKMLAAQTQAQKIRIILDTIGQSQTEAEKQRAMTRNIIIIGGIAIVLAGIVVIALKRR
jgi:hypothetical protein